MFGRASELSNSINENEIPHTMPNLSAKAEALKQNKSRQSYNVSQLRGMSQIKGRQSNLRSTRHMAQSIKSVMTNDGKKERVSMLRETQSIRNMAKMTS